MVTVVLELALVATLYGMGMAYVGHKKLRDTQRALRRQIDSRRHSTTRVLLISPAIDAAKEAISLGASRDAAMTAGWDALMKWMGENTVSIPNEGIDVCATVKRRGLITLRIIRPVLQQFDDEDLPIEARIDMSALRTLKLELKAMVGNLYRNRGALLRRRQVRPQRRVRFELVEVATEECSCREA